jgi:transposase
MRLKEGA